MRKERGIVEERKRAILDYVRTRNSADVGELCDRFSVSRATICNDLRELERSGILVRISGGAMIRNQASLERTVDGLDQQTLERKAIALRALEMVEDGDTMILDSGSATLELAQVLNAKNNITVLTNDFSIAAHLEVHPTAVIHFLGGIVRKGFHCTVNTHSEGMLGTLTVDKAFLGVTGFSLEKGGGAPDPRQYELNRFLVSIASKVYLLVDSFHLGRDPGAVVTALDMVDCLITYTAPKDLLQKFEVAGVEVVCCDKGS